MANIGGSSVIGSTVLYQGAGGGSSPTLPLHPRELRVEKVSLKVVKDLLIHKHYLHRLPNSVASYGIFAPTGELVGVITYGELNSPHAVRGFRVRYALPSAGRLLELTRLWLDDRCIKNSESRVIRISLKLLRRDIPSVCAIVAYADPSMNHSGTIYKAANFKDAGLGPQRFDWVPANYNESEQFIQTRKLPAHLKTKHGLEESDIEAKKIARVRKQRWIYRWPSS